MRYRTVWAPTVSLRESAITRRSARRQTVQSHVSRQISDFEEGFGGPLFRRTGRGVVLTELGVRVAARLRNWLQETESLAEELRADTLRFGPTLARQAKIVFESWLDAVATAESWP